MIVNCKLVGIFLGILCIFVSLSAESDSDGKDEVYRAALHDMLNSCLDAKNHKTMPGPEDSLHAQVRFTSKILYFLIKIAQLSVQIKKLTLSVLLFSVLTMGQ